MPLQQTIFNDIVEKEDIRHYEQFLLLPHCFQLFNYHTFIDREFPFFFLDIFTEVSYRFIVEMVNAWH